MTDKSPEKPTLRQLQQDLKARLAEIVATKAAMTKETGALSKRHAEVEKQLKIEQGKLKAAKAKKIGAFIGLTEREHRLRHELLAVDEKLRSELMKKLTSGVTVNAG